MASTNSDKSSEAYMLWYQHWQHKTFDGKHFKKKYEIRKPKLQERMKGEGRREKRESIGGRGRGGRGSSHRKLRLISACGCLAPNWLTKSLLSFSL